MASQWTQSISNADCCGELNTKELLPASHGQSRVSMGLSKSRTKRPADLQSVIGDGKELTTVRRARMPAVIVLRGALLTAYVPNAQMVRAPRGTSHLPRPHPPLSSTSMGERRPTVARQRACSGTGGGTIRYRWSNDNSRQHALPPPAFRHPPGGHQTPANYHPSARPIFTPSPGGFSDQLPTLIPSEHPPPEIAHVHQVGRPHPRGPTRENAGDPAYPGPLKAQEKRFPSGPAL